MSNRWILFIIVLAQFMCTSLWFAGNAIVDDLITKMGFPVNSVGHLTSAIQFGFITGTLCYALLNIADRFSPSKVFFVSAILACLSNLILISPSLTFSLSLISRFSTGFFLAGIYPVGMKIAADHFDKELGKSLGLLVGALVIGTAFPHLIRSNLGMLTYSYVIILVSTLSLIGGMLIFFLVPDGPYLKKSPQVKLSKTFAAFRKKSFKGAAFGYFGHMWELYTFYAFIPAMLFYFSNQNSTINVSQWSFIIIAAGGVGCAISGFFSQTLAPKKIATAALAISGLVCLCSPFLLGGSSSILFLVIMVIWGTTVAADSPMFSTLVAQNAIPELKGTALTIVNCIGFALTIVSIQLTGWLMNIIDFKYLFLVLSFGPILGLWHLWSNNESTKVSPD